MTKDMTPLLVDRTGMDLSRSCKRGGGGAQVRCCVSHVHRSSPMEGRVTVVGIFASLNYSNYCITVCFQYFLDNF